MSKNIEKKNNNKGLVIGLIVVICVLLLYIIIDKSNVVDSNIHKLEEAGYIKQDDGNYKLIKSDSAGLEDKDDSLVMKDYIIIKGDYSKITEHFEWRVDNKDNYWNDWYDYEYSPASNIAKGSFTEGTKKGSMPSIYSATYDFNNGSLICDAPSSRCNAYVQKFIDLKENYYSVIDNK